MKRRDPSAAIGRKPASALGQRRPRHPTLAVLPLAVLPLAGAALLASCGALTGDDPVDISGETHFLVTCEAECGAGLSCIAGVCTRGCEPDYSSCSELASEASCVSAPDGAERGGFAGTCDVLCGSDADCAGLPGEHTCRAGACRADAPAELGSSGSLRSPLVHAVDVDTCKSGLRWMGGDRPSAEMRPGSDCVGCHQDEGARPLAVGGTVFNIPGARGPDPLEDCFGLEGIEVLITDAAGREFSTLTNRAGNFYIEGDASDFTMPYRAALRWSLYGDLRNTVMVITPVYGGCARCHDLAKRVPESVGPLPGEITPETVAPTSAIFAPGLYR